jgi:hypothetical protein
METGLGLKQKATAESSFQPLAPPPGLEGCLCALFPEGEKCGFCHAAKKKDCNTAQIAIAQLLGLSTTGRRYSSI